MAEKNAQTTRGQILGDKPAEFQTVYAPDGTPQVCAPVDAREILAAGLGYTTEPPAAPAPLTGEAIFDQAYAEIEKKKAEREQQSEQQPEPNNAVADAEAADDSAAKSDDSGTADNTVKTGSRSRGKARK